MTIHMNKKWGFPIAGIILLILGLAAGVMLSQRSQNLQQEATGPACVENQATCAWDAVAGATSYQYQVIDVLSGGQVANGVVNGTTEVTFTMTPGREYKCTVSAVSGCGAGSSGEGIATCIPPTGVPTVPATNTPLPPTNTPIPSTTPSVPPSTTPTSIPATIPPSICPIPSKVTNVRIICPNCSTN